MNPTNRWRFIISAFILSFLGVMGFVFLFTATSTSQAQPAAVSFKDQDNVPVTGDVRVLCFASVDAAAPFADLMVPVVSGTPTTPLPANCNFLAALRLRHTQPSGKHEEPAYQIYSTSWQPGETVPLPASGDIMLSDSWPLTLFNVVVSLGWQPAPNSNVTSVADVRQSLAQTAQELYDWTDGQMLLGPISIHSGGERWAKADLRFVPANDKRPSAFVGGIVSDKLAYSGFLTDTTYTPAMVYLGRLWDGQDAFVEGSGRWTNTNAYRTIAHEWSHYGLFLYDAYQDSSGGSGTCICENLSASGCGFAGQDASALAYHYRATEYWHKDTHLTVANFCYDTWQFHVHGQTDWDVLLQWPDIQGLTLPLTPLRSPTPALDPGPALGLARHLVGQEPGDKLFLPLIASSSAVAMPEEPVVELILNTAVPPTNSIPSQIYLLKGGPDAPERILPQGRITDDPVEDVLGKIRLLDVEPNDTIRAYVDQPNAGSGGVRYTVTSNGAANSNIVAAENPWDVTLEHHFTLQDNQVMSLTLALEDGDGRLGIPIAQLCSLDAAIGCHPDWELSMIDNGGWWGAEFTPLPGQKELPRYLVLRIYDGGDQAVTDELVQWLQVAGGVGPTHNDGMAPLLDDVIMVNTSQPYPDAGDCNVVSFRPAANAAALAAPLPPGISGLIGIPLDIQITLNQDQDQCPELSPGQSGNLPVDVLLNFGYSQDEVDRLGLNEQTQLFILHFQPGFGWAAWQQIGVNSDLNWITGLTTEDGIYAIGWQP